MFFGLGPGELLLIAAIIALIAGPKAIPKIFKAAKQAHDVKSKLTGRAVVDYLMNDDREGADGAKSKVATKTSAKKASAGTKKASAKKASAKKASAKTASAKTASEK